MTSQALNFLWLNLDLPAKADPKDGSIREPLPAKYIDNVRKAGERHPQAEIRLWVDSRRLTKKQYAYLQAALEKDRPNVRLKDLRDIPAYDLEPLFNEPEKNARWRRDQSSTIWRQVDAAKILVSLQGHYDQVFFADLDHAHLKIDGAMVQRRLEKEGLMIGAMTRTSKTVENQLWGFTPYRREFFEDYYQDALDKAYDGNNAWEALTRRVEELISDEGVARGRFLLPINDDGSQAEQPGHEWRGLNEAPEKPSVISATRLSRVFNGEEALLPGPSASRKRGAKVSGPGKKA